MLERCSQLQAVGELIAEVDHNKSDYLAIGAIGRLIRDYAESIKDAVESNYANIQRVLNYGDCQIQVELLDIVRCIKGGIQGDDVKLTAANDALAKAESFLNDDVRIVCELKRELQSIKQDIEARMINSSDAAEDRNSN